MRRAIAIPIGIEKLSAAAPARTSTNKISSVAYATEDNASEEKTARADVRDSRSCRAWAVASGDPTNSFLTALLFTRAASGSSTLEAAAPGGQAFARPRGGARYRTGTESFGRSAPSVGAGSASG